VKFLFPIFMLDGQIVQFMVLTYAYTVHLTESGTVNSVSFVYNPS